MSMIAVGTRMYNYGDQANVSHDAFVRLVVFAQKVERECAEKAFKCEARALLKDLAKRGHCLAHEPVGGRPHA